MGLKLGLLYFLGAIGRAPTQERIARFRAFLLRQGFFRLPLEHLRKTEPGRKLIQERTLFDERTLNLDQLRALPSGTLGWEFAKFIEDNGLNPLFYPMHEIQSDEDYIGRRYLQSHDVWHVVLGYKADVLGEIELLAFAFAQFRWPLAPFLISGFLFRKMFSAPLELPQLCETVFQGWKRGLSTVPMLGQRWETLWNTPVEKIRRDLGIEV